MSEIRNDDELDFSVNRLMDSLHKDNILKHTLSFERARDNFLYAYETVLSVMGPEVPLEPQIELVENALHAGRDAFVELNDARRTAYDRDYLLGESSSIRVRTALLKEIRRGFEEMKYRK